MYNLRGEHIIITQHMHTFHYFRDVLNSGYFKPYEVFN